MTHLTPKQKAINSIDWVYPYNNETHTLTLTKLQFERAIDIAIEETVKDIKLILKEEFLENDNALYLHLIDRIDKLFDKEKST